MYEQFFGLRERPFDLTPNPRFLVMTEAHAEALSNLEYAVASRKGITLLVGEAGSGKTTLIHAAIEKQPMKVHCVHLHNPTLTREEFVEMLAARFELSSGALASKTTMLLELEELVRTRQAAGETTVLIIDEAQSLPLDLLEEIRLLANIETNEEKLLSVIIAGQPELAARLNDTRLRQFKQRVALRCELRALTETETAGYIAGRIAAAGGIGAKLFTRDAVTLIYQRSRGIPRTISVIADNALLGGFGAGVQPVSAQIVADVCRDFDLGASEAAATEAARAILGFDAHAAGEKNTRDADRRVVEESDPEAAGRLAALREKLMLVGVPSSPATLVEDRESVTDQHVTAAQDQQVTEAPAAEAGPRRRRFPFFKS
jgi:general secretion pathway protein A